MLFHNMNTLTMRFLFIILFVSSTCFAQTKTAIGRIVYENTSGKTIDFLDMWFSGSAYKCSRNLNADAILKGGMKSSYNSIEDSLADVKKMEIRKQALTQMPSVQTYYAELGKKETYNVVRVGESSYAIIDSTPLVKWEVQNDTQTISGLLCQKATGTTAVSKTRITAWFAPSIPTSIAPFTLRGLPGLLVEASYDTQPVSIRMLSLDYPVKEKQDISFPSDITIITISELRQKQAKRSQDLRNMSEHYKNQIKEGQPGVLNH